MAHINTAHASKGECMLERLRCPVPYAFAASARCLLHPSEQGCRCEGLNLSPLYPPWLKTGPQNPSASQI